MTWSELESGARGFRLKPEYVAELRRFYQERCDPDFLADAARRLPAPGDFPEDELARRYCDAKGRNQFRLLCAVACYPVLEKYYRDHRLPQEMLHDIGGDLEIWVETLYRDYGYAGLADHLKGWFAAGLNGGVKQLGRLQFNTVHFFWPRLSLYRRKDGSILCHPSLEKTNPPCPDLSHQDKAINIHIPAAGPLLRRECIRSIARAAEFSAEYQPDYDYRAFVCYSWILDPTFRTILPPTSNILDFQRLGHVLPLPDVDQTDTVRWRIWGDAGLDQPLDRLKQRNSLQRSVAGHLRSGGRFIEGALVIWRDELPALLSELDG